MLAAASAGLLLAGTAAPSAGLAAATTTITSLTVPAAPVDLETSPGAVIRAHIVDSVGVVPGDMSDEIDGATYLCVSASDPGGDDGCYAQSPHLVSGTAKDGEWEFDPFDGKRAYGGWEATRIHVVRADGTSRMVDLRPLPFPRAFRTIGRFGAFFDRQSPTSAENTTITYGGTVTLRARAYWIDELVKRHPIAHQQVRVVQEDQAEPVIDGDERLLTTVTTAADGTLAVTVKPERKAFRLYLMFDKGTSADGVRYMDGIAWTGRVDVRVRIGIRSKPSTLPARTVGYVEGNVIPAVHAGQNAYLQRYSGGSWKIVSSAKIRSSGRFTLAAQPPGRGSYRYRVYKASDALHVYNVTRPFTIVGT
ncbi:hypothetical protein Ani05nite_65120 [Amorphoplanes nipponensis]|uniref:Uncharacterized protein n=1 Tax=Actinoplanes nipponensis TaxID=135950 RepID=A0A919JLF8_9ACTN|nr:hypothetical protein Ani05nite_65120 [Actinoplanes nipponensis]